MQQQVYEHERPISDDIRDFVVAIGRNFRIGLVTLFATLALVILYIWLTTPLYSSKVEILIDPRQRQTVDGEVTPTGLGTSAAGADTLLLESQVEVLRSQRVIDALIEAENLIEDPEFSGSSGSGPIEVVKYVAKMVIYGPQQELWHSTSAYDRTVTKLHKRLDVDRLRNTYVITVTMKSSDAEKAARIANRLAEIYIAEVNKASASSTEQVATILSSKLDELRTIAQVDAEAVEQYRRENGLIDANSTLVVEQQLADLNRELSKARADVQSASAQRNQFRVAFETGSNAGVQSSDFGDSAVMSELQSRLAEIDSEEAELAAVYLDSHPSVRRARERKTALLTSIRREYGRILERLEVIFQAAKEREESLQREVGNLEAMMANSNASTVRLRDLQREAESSRRVYETFLQRSKEAQEQIDLPSSTARIISVAYPASKPGHPAVPLLLAGGIGAGLSLGVLAALLASLFGRRSEDDTMTPAPAAEVREWHRPRPAPVRRSHRMIAYANRAEDQSERRLSAPASLLDY
jgi:uncharacterized protein involved in exopolysaccharide biosynthesis